MPNANKISAAIVEQDITTMLSYLEDIKKKLPFLLDLSVEEKMELPKMRDKNVSWVHKTFEYATTNPGLIPTYIDHKEWAKDVKLAQDLLRIFRPLSQLVSQVDDSLTLAGSEAMTASLGFYNNLKAAVKAGVPGSKPMLEDLSSRFPGRTKTTNKKEQETS
jgi:hypothetical protein